MEIAGHHILKFEDVQPDAHASTTVVVTEELIRRFATMTGDSNPLHTSDEFAGQTLFGKINMQGQLMSSLIVGVIGSKLPGPGWFCLGVNADFPQPGYVGDEVTAEVVFRQKIDAAKVVVWDGYVRRTSDQKLLARATIKTRWMF